MVKKYKPCPAFGLCLDWETSGANWGYKPSQQANDFQGITFGAVIYNTKTLEPVETLYRELKFDHNKYKWTSEAEAIHGKSMAYLDRVGVDRIDAALDLMEMVIKYFGPNAPVPFMGHNRDFDMAFNEQLFRDTGVPSFAYHHVNIDSSGVAFTLLDVYKSDDVFDLLGLPERKDHNALEDALMTLESMRRIKMLVQLALG
jgi:DNA polymerase III epsilon subunit-like protein